jgi:hypothetical protein
MEFDPTFQKMRKSFGRQPAPSHWQAKCGFAIKRDKLKSSVIPQGTILKEGAAPAAAEPVARPGGRITNANSFENTPHSNTDATLRGSCGTTIKSPTVQQQ